MHGDFQISLNWGGEGGGGFYSGFIWGLDLKISIEVKWNQFQDNLMKKILIKNILYKKTKI